MLRFEVSLAADKDLENIFNYGVDNFGVEPTVFCPSKRLIM